MAIMTWRRAAALGVTVAGAVAAGVTAQFVADRHRTERRARRGEDTPFGSLHSTRRAVLATDGVSLNVEVDEPDDDAPADVPTIFFAHGWVLDLNCWHYQRAALRGQARLVFYDQRSHGLSGRSGARNSTLEQLGQDLKTVIDEVAPTGPVILVGHSMGGMTIMSLADQFAEFVRERVIGVALLGTSAGHLIGKNGAFGRAHPVVIGGLARMTYLIDQTRKVNQYALTRRLALAPDAPEKYADMTDEMISRASTHVFWDFYPNFTTLDLYHALAALPGDRTIVIAGTKDQLTVLRHSRKLAEVIDGSELIVCEGAGHMMMLEAHEQVNESMIKLLERATA